MNDPTPTPSHDFIRPGQVAPDLPAPDACVECGQSAATHHAASYITEATAADERLDQALEMLRREQQAGEITTCEAAAERVAAMEKHLARIRELRARFFGG